ANVRHQRFQFLHRVGGRVDVGHPQSGTQQVLSAKYVQRQVAVIVVVTVIEAPLLPAIQDIIGGIQIQNDSLRNLLVRVQEQIHQQGVDTLRIDHDLLGLLFVGVFLARTAVVVRRCQLQAV